MTTTANISNTGRMKRTYRISKPLFSVGRLRWWWWLWLFLLLKLAQIRHQRYIRQIIHICIRFQPDIPEIIFIIILSLLCSVALFCCPSFSDHLFPFGVAVVVHFSLSLRVCVSLSLVREDFRILFLLHSLLFSPYSLFTFSFLHACLSIYMGCGVMVYVVWCVSVCVSISVCECAFVCASLCGFVCVMCAYVCVVTDGG